MRSMLRTLLTAHDSDYRDVYDGTHTKSTEFVTQISILLLFVVVVVVGHVPQRNATN